MAVLNHYQMGRIMKRLELSAKDQKAFKLILPLLNESNKAIIAAIHEALYPFSNTSSANGSLKNLCNRFTRPQRPRASTSRCSAAPRRRVGRPRGSCGSRDPPLPRTPR